MDNTKECWSKDNEDFNCSDLGDLLDTYGDELRPGDTVYQGAAKEPSISSLVDADSVIEDIASSAWDFGEEYAEGYPEVTPDHKAKLQTLLENWLSECPSPRFYRVVDAKPYILTADDFSEERLAEIAEEDAKPAPKEAP